jgi:hypothetical protein
MDKHFIFIFFIFEVVKESYTIGIIILFGGEEEDSLETGL